MIFGNNDKRQKHTIPDFLHANKDLLVFVCDPKTDNIIVAYKDAMVSGQLKSADGKRLRVVKGVLTHSIFDKHIDGFLGGVSELIKLKIMDKAGNQFFKFIDGALFNVSKRLRENKREKVGRVESRVKDKVVQL